MKIIKVLSLSLSLSMEINHLYVSFFEYLGKFVPEEGIKNYQKKNSFYLTA